MRLKARLQHGHRQCICRERMGEFTVAQAFVADRRMRCFILLLRLRRQIGIVRNLVRNCAHLAKAKQHSKGEREDQAP